MKKLDRTYWCETCGEQIVDWENDMHSEGLGDFHADCCSVCKVERWLESKNLGL